MPEMLGIRRNALKDSMRASWGESRYDSRAASTVVSVICAGSPLEGGSGRGTERAGRGGPLAWMLDAGRSGRVGVRSDDRGPWGVGQGVAVDIELGREVAEQRLEAFGIDGLFGDELLGQRDEPILA